MDKKSIRCFETVYEQKSINRAAKLLYITPQGLSKIILNLEEEFDTKLFIRTKNGMNPTESGDFLYDQCQSLMSYYEKIYTGMKKIKEGNNKIYIDFSHGVLNVFPLEKFHYFDTHHNKVDVEWNEKQNDEVIKDVLSGRVDVGFVIGNVNNNDLHTQCLFSTYLDVLVYPDHSYYHYKTLSMSDLKNEDLITLNEKFYLYQSFVSRAIDFDYVPHIVVKTLDSQLIYRFCKNKVGLGIDVNIHQDDDMLGDLHRIPLSDAFPWEISIIYRKDSQKIKVMKELFDETLSNICL